MRAGMPGTAGVNVIPAEGRCAQRPSFPRTREPREKQSTPLPPSLREGGASEPCDASGGCPGRRGVNVIPADAGTQRGRATEML